jgi:8-oxo-dGTP diphosphatase
MNINNQINISQKIILVNINGEILTMRRGKTAPSRPGYWDLPGGDLEFGEDLKDGIIREVKEETGLDIDIPTLLDVFSAFNDRNEFWVTICYFSKVESADVKLSFEHDSFKWIHPKEFQKLKVSPKNKRFVQTFINTFDK